MEFTGQKTQVTVPKPQKLSERKDEQRFVAMFVGRHHTGKTAAAASFPGPIHFEDFDGRIEGAKYAGDRDDITYNYWPPKSPRLIDELNAKFNEMLNISQIQTPNSIIKLPKTHVTDSITNQTYAFLSQSIPLTHPDSDHGRWLGPQMMAGPDDYNMEKQATLDYLSFILSLKIPNIIVSGHLVDMYGTAEDERGKALPYAPRVVVNQKLSITDKLGENIQTKFSHIFRFERTEDDKFKVQFRGGIACTAFPWLPTGKHEWTGRQFYEFMWSFRKDKQDGKSNNQSA